MMHPRLFLLLLIVSPAFGQADLITPFKNCQLDGSITIFDYHRKQWLYSDSVDAQTARLPASTFKIINLLVALETKVIRNENDIIKWPGTTDTLIYGYRPEIYHDMTVREAFTQSAGWVFIELAKRVGRERYRYYLTKANYGNGMLSEPGLDFWNIGPFGISPINQVRFLKNVYEGNTPFSRRNLAILKRVMLTETTSTRTLRSKTGWTRYGGTDLGWWVGYVEKAGNCFFFATRVSKSRQVQNMAFGECRKSITRTILQQLNAW